MLQRRCVIRGVVLSGGLGTRLGSLTEQINKHLLPVYSKPMVYYPIETLRAGGITDIMVVLGGNSVGEIIQQLGDGSKLGVSLTYRFQSSPDGIGGALKLAEDFSRHEPIAVILGDNIFSQPIEALGSLLPDFDSPVARVFLSPTDRPKSFGIALLEEDRVVSIIEKPVNPPSNLAVTGLYLYNSYLWDAIKTLKKSARGEFEITDINNAFIENGILLHSMVEGIWQDAGSVESLYKANTLMALQDSTWK